MAAKVPGWRRPRRVTVTATAILTAALLATGLATVPATAAQTAASVRTAPARPAATPASQTTALTSLAARARLAARSAAAKRSGVIYGTVVGEDERPLAGACVTAIGAGRSLTLMAGSDGQFALTGLRPGQYVLEYRDCAAPAKYLARWSGGVNWRSAATPLTVGTDQVRHVPAMMLLPVRAAAALPDRASFERMVAHADGRGVAASAAATGRISGLVTGGGKKLGGICIVAFAAGGGEGYGTFTAKNGTYTIRRMAPGRYDITFAPFFCGETTNWLQQEYPNENGPFSAGRPVKATGGKTTTGIDGHLRLGGQISGTVTSAAGKKLRGMCVNSDGAVRGGFLSVTLLSNRRGGYALHALFPGTYTITADVVGCGAGGNYVPAVHKPVKIGHGQVVSGVNLVMATGAEVTGKVTAGSSTGQPLAGMCVFATNRTGSINGDAATGKNGAYTVEGLGSGTYQIQFAPGCDNNANYVASYAAVHTTEGKVTTGINAALQVGGIISGTVTNTSSKPVAGMCITLEGTGFGNTPNFTTGNGTYQINQLPAGTYEVGFGGGCGNSGSYAPYWYSNQTDPALATPIVLPAGGTQAVNAVLQPGATISGKVTVASGARPPYTCVSVGSESLAEFGAVSDVGRTENSGTYSIPNLAPGQYLVDFGCDAFSGYASQWFRGAPDAGDADLVSAEAGTTTGIDAVLKPGGSISGVVTGARGYRLAGICVGVFSTADKTSMFQTLGEPGSGATTPRGRWSIGGVAPGRYDVTFAPCLSNLRYAQQTYRNQASEANATAVTVRAGARTAAIDARLAVGGSISGRVETPAGKPLRNICVVAFNLATDNIGGATTGATGSYRIIGLNSASYEVEFFPCNSALNRVSVLTTARVTAPTATTGVNATLVPGGSLSGTLTAAPSGAGVQDGCVEAISSDPANPGGSVQSGLNGEYTLTGLAPGKYQVYFNDPECATGPMNLAPQWYSSQPTQASASPVTVTVGATTPDINAALQPDGEITGTVSGPSADALTGVCVAAVPTSGYALTDGALPVVAVTKAGGYILADLLPGRYKVEFSSGCGASGYATQWWQDASSEATATALTVKAGEDLAGVNAILTG